MNSSGKDANCFFLTFQGQQLKLLTVYLIILENLQQKDFYQTTGGSCVTLATDKGERVVRCSKCIFWPVDLGSPIINSIYMLIIVICNKYFKLYISNVLCYKYSINNYY